MALRQCVKWLWNRAPLALLLRASGSDLPRFAAKAVAQKLRAMKLKEAAKKVEDGVLETLTYMNFPHEHWMKIRSNNAIERLNREIRRRTRVVGAFPDSNSALMLVCARLRYMESSLWGTKCYLNMKLLETYQPKDEVTADFNAG